MGLVFELEESNFAGWIDDGEIFPAQLIQTGLKERKYRDEEVKRVTWKFRINTDGPFDQREVWGETSTRFVDHPDCRLKSWAESLLGQRLPPGYRLDLDVLIDRQCRIIVGRREYDRDGETRVHNFVREVHPTREAMAALAKANDEPF